MTEPIAIIGANAAGATAAASLRDEGHEGEIVLLGNEPLQPYERPPLSKEVLRGEQGAADQPFRPEEYWRDNRIDVRLGVQVDRIDLDAHTLTFADDDQLAWSRLVIATGVRNRQIDIPGHGLDGVYSLRTAADAEQIRHAALDAEHVVIVGFGFIGAEVAASMRQLNKHVTIIEPASTALERVLGAEFGATIEAIHRDHGVEMILNDAPERFEGADRVQRVVTTGGVTVEADMVVAGIGTIPNQELAAEAGLSTDNGIDVDVALATDHPDVFAIGDIAAHDHPLFGRIRVEHFDNAQKMGQHVARVIVAKDRGEAPPTFTNPHWFWSDQYDSSIQMAGFTTQWRDPVIRGSVEDRSFSAFQLADDGRLMAVLGIDANRDVRRSLALVGLRHDPAMLADPELDLRTLKPRPPEDL